MVSQKNKARLRSAARKAAGAAKKAGKAYWKYSGEAAERMKEKAAEDVENARREAEGVVRNPEPNDGEDARLYRQVQQNHREVMDALRSIERGLDELSAPPAGGGSDFAPGFALGETHDEPGDEFDYTRWL